MLKYVVAIVLATAPVAICQGPKVQPIEDRIGAFCKMEFDGDQADRTDFFKDNSHYANGVDFASEPVVIVDGYKVISIEISGNNATAILDYDALGKFENVTYYEYPGVKSRSKDPFYRADKLVVMKNPNLRQSVHLVRESGQHDWLIAEPVVPKVSKSALLSLLHKEVGREQEILERNKLDQDIRRVQNSLIKWNLKKIKLIEDLGKHDTPLKTKFEN